jgi:hypothetical protein
MWASVVSVVIILCIHHTVASFSVRDHRPSLSRKIRVQLAHIYLTVFFCDGPDTGPSA